MIDRVRSALAARAARAALAARTPAEPRALGARRVLLVLPADPDGQHEAWALVKDLGLRPEHVRAFVVGDHVGSPPGAFAGHVATLDDDARDWRGLPTPAARAAAWADRPDVAVDLADPGDLGAALLVGASPAAVRVGRHRPDREAFFDLMVADGDAPPAEALGRLLRALAPPIL